MAKLQLHFWNWDTAVLPKAVEELTRGWKGGELDLSRTIVLAPTAETVRRLREALAVAVAGKEGAVVAPFVWHPEFALMHEVDRAGLLTPLQEQLLWRAVLEGIEIADYAALFPTEPAATKETWAAGVGESLAKLRSSVGAGGMSLAEVARKLGGGIDAARWNELAALEKLYLAKAKELGLRDAQEVKQERAGRPVLPNGVDRLCVLALADATPLLKRWIQNAATQVKTDVFVQAPADRANTFDELGNPILEVWREVAKGRLELNPKQLHLVADPPQQARSAVTLLRGIVKQGKTVAMGLADPTLAPHFEGAFTGEEVRTFDPAGRKASRHALLEVLRTWQRLAQTRTFRSLAAFLRLEDVLRVVASRTELSARDFLATLDEFYEERLPPTLDEAVTLSAQPLPGRFVPNEEAVVETDAERLVRIKKEALQKVNGALRDVAMRLEAWQNGGASEALRELLEWIYGAREFATEAEDDRGYTFLFGEVMQLAEEARSTAEKLRMSAHAGALAPTLLRTLQEVQLPDTRGEIDLVLQGWLELLWEPAEALVICGFNDESVPGKIAPDPFLPDHVREELGLACQTARRARDAYLLTALAAQHHSSGALHLVIGQTNDAGDVLRPSRLLFACDDAELPQRVKHLFPEKAPALAMQQPAHKIAWKLAPWRVEKGMKSVTVSLLSSYLRCPLRCGLERFLNMSAVDTSQREMTPGDFGGMVHEVLAAFGREKSLRDSVSEPEIRKYFDESLDEIVKLRWGLRPLLSTVLQVESARQRLAYAAVVQASLRNEGWRIREVELDIDESRGLKIGDVPFRGRLDRVDEHVQTGALRVWDYKTRAKVLSPLDAHSETLKGDALEDETLEWKTFDDAKGKPRLWMDLQLPLYVWALRAVYPQAPRIEAGYIHLPAAVTESKPEIWPELNEDLIARAFGCAEEAVRRMKEGIFWPPSDEVGFDAFEELLLGDACESVVESALWKGVTA